MKEFFDYKDVRIVPKKGIVRSRKECSTAVLFGENQFDLPVCPANMKSVVDQGTCEFFASKGLFYIYHRFHDNYIKEQLDFCKNMMEKGYIVSISIGVKGVDKQLLREIKEQNIRLDYLTIDIAHGHSILMEEMMKYVRDTFPEVFLIVGNICTVEALNDLEKWGASAVKVGAGCGNPCITYNKTGVGNNGCQLSSVKACSEIASVPLIADGGVVEHGDVAKAITCGADVIMAGSLFAGYDQSAGSIIEIEDRSYKEYYGSASKHNKSERKNIEGKKILIPYRGDMEKLLVELKEDLQSSISYVGGKTLKDLERAEFFVI